MKMRSCVLSALLSFGVGASSGAGAATVETLVFTPLTIEGLTHDNDGNLYTPGRRTAGDAAPCPVWRVAIDDPALVLVGTIPPGTAGFCSPSGLAFDSAGFLYVTETDRIYKLKPSASAPPPGTLFATGVPGTNGLAFDGDGNLWTGDGTTGQGRVWKIDPAGNVTLMFRIPPMVNTVGVGRNAITQPPGTAQPLVANGLAFDKRGDLLVADTARGALWRVSLARDGSVASPVDCDTTFVPGTLCFENLLVAHPWMDGLDGIALDVAGNIWGVANERNAVVFVDHGEAVAEVFRNPPVANLRNGGPLESPASPVLAGHRFCTSNSDGNRRDNSPNAAGEISPAGANKGKISCFKERVNVKGVTLPER
jgi:sugar lactone lactonase YvrE